MYKRRLDQRGAVIPDSVEKHKVGPEQDEKLLAQGERDGVRVLLRGRGGGRVLQHLR